MLGAQEKSEDLAIFAFFNRPAASRAALRIRRCALP